MGGTGGERVEDREGKRESMGVSGVLENAIKVLASTYLLHDSSGCFTRQKCVDIRRAPLQ